ncbi:MAG: biotin-dependent carboxyltransferase family protein [Bacteroidota bacterium]
MGLAIVKEGLCDTIQDAGRKGFAASGINPGGAMDVLAMKIANALVGNSLTEAVLEMHFPAPVIYFHQPAIIAISGADLNAVLDLQTNHQALQLPINKTAFVNAGTTLSFKNKIIGERACLAVKGGFNLPLWFGSYSTNIKIKEGGFKGRTLKAGDHLSLMKKHPALNASNQVFPWSANMQSWYADPGTCNFLAGPEWHWLNAASQKQFTNIPFTLTAQSDRMGLHLEGNSIGMMQQQQLLSSGVNFGMIQLLPNGNLVILAADHPTTGGYPRIANVITAHLPKLAQAKPGTKIRFLHTSLENAQELLGVMQKELLQLQQAVAFKLQ